MQGPEPQIDYTSGFSGALDWKCLVELLKYVSRLLKYGYYAFRQEPLLHMGVIGMGTSFRRVATEGNLEAQLGGMSFQ